MNIRPRSSIRSLLFLAAVAFTLPAQAGGPSSLLTPDGVPYHWDNSQPIVYSIDQGQLGRYTNEQAVAIVNAAFAEWQKVETAKIQFQQGDPLDRDVTGTNLSSFLDQLGNTINPVIFDNDGRVIDAFLGTGASRSVVAVGGVFGAGGDGIITQGVVIVNGRAADGLFDPDDPSQEELTRRIARAIGQMLGLGASDANDELSFDGDVANNRAIPVIGISTFSGAGFSPSLDDRMTLSWLYPADSLDSRTGILTCPSAPPAGIGACVESFHEHHTGRTSSVCPSIVKAS